MGRRPGCRSVGGGSPGAVLSRLLFDTTFLIDAERSGETLDDVIDDDDDVCIAAITVAELRVGVLLASDQWRSGRSAFLQDLLEAVPILDYDCEVAEAHAQLLVHARREGRPRGAHDLIIAATAKAANRTVVSADGGAFANLPGVPVRAHRH